MEYSGMVKKIKAAYERIDTSGVNEHFAIQFNISGEAEGAFYVEFAEGRVNVQPYEYYDRDLIINTDLETAIDMANGKVGLAEAYEAGKINVWGEYDRALDIYQILVFSKKRKGR